MATPSRSTDLLRLAQAGPVRARDLTPANIPRTYLKRLTERGLLEHVGRGLYRLPNAEVSELHTLAEVAKRVPHGVVCLLSALQVHALTTEVPHAVWIMIDTRARSPKLDTPAIEVVRASGDAREYGVEERAVEGVRVRVTSPAKTVADCFRYRRHVGLDVAVEALRDFLARGHGRPTRREREVLREGGGFGYGSGSGAGNGDGRGYGDPWFFSVDALVEAAKADRIYTVMRPYLEALA